MINLERAREWLGRVDVRNDVAAPSALAALYDLMRSREKPPEAGAELLTAAGVPMAPVLAVHSAREATR